MKKIIGLIIFFVLTSRMASGQCNALYSFGAYFETVEFYNQSTVANAHYFWNFGDGTGSNIYNPVHKFPENGNYLVTLFATDTVTNCSSYYEYWVNVTKYSTDSCQTSISDDIATFSGDDFFQIINQSINCNSYFPNCDGGPGSNFSPNTWVGINNYWQTIAFRMVGRIQYYGNDSIIGSFLAREAYRTISHNYTSARNYDDCSANFEFTVIYEDTTGQRILFRAMNITASYYEWVISGFGGPITSNNDTISQFYPFNPNDLWHTGLIIQGQGGCNDTMYQNILVRENVETTVSIAEEGSPIKCSLYPNPAQDKVTISISEITNTETIQYSIFNMLGEKLKAGFITENNYQIDVSNLSEGLYIVEIAVGNNRVCKKLLKA